MISIRNSKKAAYFCAVAVSVLWGLSYIGSKEAIAGGLKTFSIIAVRFLNATALLFVIARIAKEDLRIKKRDILPMAVSSVTGITFYYFCELNGLMRTSASVASLIISTIPVFSLLTAVVFRHKRPAPLTWVGVAMSLTGVYLLVFTDFGENSAVGFLFLLCTVLNWIVYLEVTDKLLKRYSGLTVTFWQSLFALISLIPLALTEDVAWADVPLRAWLWTILFLGFICSAACFLMNNYAISKLSPQMTAIFLNLSPVATAAGGYLLLGETITRGQLIGGIVVLASLCLITISQRRTEV